MSEGGQVTRAGESTVLACGRDPEALLAQVADGSAVPVDAHQRGCPHCRAALVEIDRFWGPVRALARHRPSAPPGVLEGALARVRAIGTDPEYRRVRDADGQTRIAARAVATLARHLAGRERGVRVALGRLVGAPAAVEIVIAADYGVNLPALAERVRRRVIDGVRELTGLEPVSVSVVVDDVLTHDGEK